MKKIDITDIYVKREDGSIVPIGMTDARIHKDGRIYNLDEVTIYYPEDDDVTDPEEPKYSHICFYRTTDETYALVMDDIALAVWMSKLWMENSDYLSPLNKIMNDSLTTAIVDTEGNCCTRYEWDMGYIDSIPEDIRKVFMRPPLGQEITIPQVEEYEHLRLSSDKYTLLESIRETAFPTSIKHMIRDVMNRCNATPGIGDDVIFVFRWRKNKYPISLSAYMYKFAKSNFAVYSPTYS